MVVVEGEFAQCVLDKCVNVAPVHHPCRVTHWIELGESPTETN